MRIREAQHPRVLVPQPDHRAGAHRSCRAVFELRDDRPGVLQAREPCGALEKAPQLGLLPGAKQGRRRREAGKEAQTRRKTEDLHDPVDGAGGTGKNPPEAHREKRRTQQERTCRDGLHAAMGDAGGPCREAHERGRVVRRYGEEVDDDPEDQRRRRGRGHERECGDAGDETDLGRALDPRPDRREVVDEAQQQVRHRKQHPDDDVVDDGIGRESERGRDERLQDDERQPGEVQRDIQPRAGRGAERLRRDDDRDQDVDRVVDVADELERRHARRF